MCASYFINETHSLIVTGITSFAMSQRGHTIRIALKSLSQLPSQHKPILPFKYEDIAFAEQVFIYKLYSMKPNIFCGN
jgi:hypothetical protein